MPKVHDHPVFLFLWLLLWPPTLIANPPESEPDSALYESSTGTSSTIDSKDPVFDAVPEEELDSARKDWDERRAFYCFAPCVWRLGKTLQKSAVKRGLVAPNKGDALDFVRHPLRYDCQEKAVSAGAQFWDLPRITCKEIKKSTRNPP